MRTFVMGDLHGAWQALVQCLERSGFQRKEDTLIHLGNVVDVNDDVYKCVETLMEIPKLIAIRGDHDERFTMFLDTGYHPALWTQGGVSTLTGYLRQVGKEDFVGQAGSDYMNLLRPEDVPENHQRFFHQQNLYYVDEENRCFVHGGFDRNIEFSCQSPHLYYCDQQLWTSALYFEQFRQGVNNDAIFRMSPKFESVFIGHSSTVNWGTDQPMRAANVWNLNTGAGYGGKLTIMDVETKEFWQSDPVKGLYRW